MIDLLIVLLQDLKAAGPLGVAGSVASIIGIGVGFYQLLRYFRRKGYARLEEKVAEHERREEAYKKSISNLKRVQSALEKEVQEYQKVDIGQIVMIAEKERNQGNEAIALQHLRSAISIHSKQFTYASTELARHHLSLFEMDDKHLANACRYAMFAFCQAPDSVPVRNIIAELEALQGNREISRRDFALAAQHFDDAYDFAVGGYGREIGSLIEQLLRSCVREDRKGHYQTAFALARQAYILSRNELPAPVSPLPPDVRGVPIRFVAQHAYAKCFRQLGQFTEALSLFEDVYQNQLEVLGASHQSTLRTAHSIAICLGQLGRHEEALGRHQEIYRRSIEGLGADHPDTLSMAEGFAISLGDLGRRKEALELSEDIHKRQTKALGVDHPDTLQTANSIADLLGRLGKHKEALARQKDVYRRRTKVLGADHPETLNTVASLADHMGNLGQRNEALARHEEVHRRRTGLLGADHPDTKKSERAISKLKVVKEAAS